MGAAQSEVGINFKATADTSGLSSFDQALDRVREKLEAVYGSNVTQQEVLETYEQINKSAEDRLKWEERIARLQTEKRRNESGGSGGGGSDGNVSQFPLRGIFAAERMARGLPGGLSRDPAGTVAAAGEGIISEIGKMWTKLPLAAKLAVGGGAVLAGGAIVGNELSKQYEGVAPQMMETTAALRLFGTTAAEQSRKFRETMDRVSSSSAKFGYTLSQGAGIVESIARGGAATGAAEGLASDVMRMSRSLGSAQPISELADLATLGSRFGLSGNIAEYALGSAMNTKIGSQRTAGQASALAAMIQGGVDQGIQLTDSEAARMAKQQNWLYSAFGERAAGMGGAAAYGNLSGAMRGATGLKSETDVLLFLAAQQAGDGSYTDAMERMEKGFDADTFDKFKGSLTGNRTSKIEMIRKAFGVNYTTARQMLDASSADEAKAFMESEGPGKQMKNTSEAQLASLTEQIAEAIRQAGAKALDVKVGALGAVNDVVDFLTGKKTIKDIIKIDQATIKSANTVLQVTSDTLEKMNPSIMSPEDSLQFSFHNILSASRKNGGPGSDILKIFSDPASLSILAGMGPGVFNKIMEIDKNERGSWTQNELRDVLAVLKEILELNKNPKPTIVPSSPSRGTQASSRGM